MKNVNKHISNYLSFLAKKQRSERTLRNYDFYLKRFIAWSKENKVSSLEKVDAEAIRKYKLWLKAYKDPVRKVLLSKSTQNYHLIALRGFFSYLAKKKINTILSDRVKLDKTRNKTAIVLDKSELGLLLEAPFELNQDPIIVWRDKAILELLFCSGIKVAEAASLKKSQFDISKKGNSYLARKANAKLKLSNQAAEALRQYLKLRKDKFDYIFISHDRAISSRRKVKPLSARTIERVVEKYGKHSGLRKKVTPQVLRNTYIRQHVLRGKGLESVKKMLNYKNTSSTKAYLGKLAR
jgi:site-specific recombinase XerD